MPTAIRRSQSGPISRSRRSIEALVEPFEGYLHQSQLKPATVRSYAADVRAFVRWLSDQGAKVLAADQFTAYRDFLVQAAQHSSATVNRRLQALRVFGRFLEHRGETRSNPAVQLRLVPNGKTEPALPREVGS